MLRHNMLLSAALLASTALVSISVMPTPAKAQQIPAQFVNAQTGTTYTFVQTDCSKLVTFSNSSAIAGTLPQAGTAGLFFGGCFFDVENKGAGTLTITPATSTINGASTLVLSTGQGARIVSDGTNYQVQLGAGGGAGTTRCNVKGASGTTCNGIRGLVEMTGLTNASGAAASYTVSNSSVVAASVMNCTLGAYGGTLTTNGIPLLVQCTPGSGGFTVTIANMGTTVLAGTLNLQFEVIN